MEKYKMGRDLNQAIVNGILQGYKNYLEERKAKKESMHISAAYAWVKGNHIDDQTVEECKELGVKFRKAKAGYTWGYLQFSMEEDKRMFIIKNGQYFDEENFPVRKGIPKEKKETDNESYLQSLARINSNVEFPKERNLFTMDDEEKYVRFFDDETWKQLEQSEASGLAEEFNQFYILIYEIDEGYAISKIRMLMPNPHNDIAYEIDDLSEYIGKSSVSFEESDYEVLVEDGYEKPESPAATDYGVIPAEKWKDEEEREES